jgi:hypothetical protein
MLYPEGKSDWSLGDTGTGVMASSFTGKGKVPGNPKTPTRALDQD